MESGVAQVAVETRVGSLSGLFDYAVPEALTGLIEVGHRVRVPFGKRTVTGFVYALEQGPTVLELKPIEALLDAEPVLPSPLVELAGFVAAHYLVPLDEVIRAIVPPRVRAVVHRSVKRRRQSRILRQAATVSVPETIDFNPSELISSRRSGAMVPRPPIMIPRLPKLAKPHIAYSMISRERGSSTSGPSFDRST